MKLIQTSKGYVNANMIEAFEVVTYESCCEIVAYGSDCKQSYVIGKCEGGGYDEDADAVEAFARLDDLANWLISGKDGIFDVMHTRESDDE